MLVAIHQPNFFPWLGFFNKIARADVFCLLDNVQFQKTAGTWTNRVRLLLDGRPGWVTAPVARNFHGTRLIRDTRISHATPWRDKIVRTIRTSYGRARCFAEVFPLVEELILNPMDDLAAYNERAIRRLCAALDLRHARLLNGSSMQVDGQATELLISMVQAAGGTRYLCGGGAAEYQEDASFAEAGIELQYQNFEHPVYEQRGAPEFVPGLSVIDALMHCGFEATARMIREP